MIDLIRWKFVAAVAILAMVVSLLSGGLSGIGFGTLIFRAFLGGVIFAGLATALNLLVVRAFPELLENDGTDESGVENSSNSPGARVDIVLPAQEPSGIGIGETEDLRQTDLSGTAAAGDESVDNLQGDGLEEVGDLDSFSDAFSETEAEAGNSGHPESNALGGNQEPEELAQAIQTVMKRDEKG